MWFYSVVLIVVSFRRFQGWFEGSCEEMLLRLRDIKKDMETNNTMIDDIKSKKLFNQADWQEIEQTL